MKQDYYYSVRVVKAKSEDDAIDKVCDELFVEDHELMDVVLTKEQLIEALKNTK